MVRTFLLTLFLLPALCCVCLAEDLAALQDRFYTGMAEAIENNMEDPRYCLQAVDSYIAGNQRLVEQLRRETEKAMTQAAPMMQEMFDKYSSMTENELRALEDAQQPKRSAAMIRYSNAVTVFSTKHPEYGLELAGKIIQVMMDPARQMQMPARQMQMPMQPGW